MTDEKPEGAKIENSCGCIFCDLGDSPREFEGKPAHFLGNGDVIFCTRMPPGQNKTPN